MTEQDAAVQTADDQPTPENGIVAEPVPAEASADTEAETPEGAATEDDASEEGSGDEASDEEGAEASERRMSRREEALTNEGEIAADYLEELLDIADLDGDIDTFNEGGRAHVSILTDADVLVGKNGEVLEALQELSRLAVMTETGHREAPGSPAGSGRRRDRRGEGIGRAGAALPHEPVRAQDRPRRDRRCGPDQRVRGRRAPASCRRHAEGLTAR